MKRKVFKKALALVLAGAVTFGFSACSNSGNSGKEENTENTEKAEENGSAKSDIVVGFSSGCSGTTFRQEGIDDFKKVAEEYKEAGRIKDYKIVNNTNDWDTDEQANIIRDMTNDDEINVIVVNPNSPTDLNGVLEEAVDAGKVVVSADCEVDVEGVTCVSVDHYEWGKKVAEYVCESLQPEGGNVIQIYGAEGHPANNERVKATEDVLKDYDNINMVASETGSWDESTAKEVASQILSAGQKVDGIITQDAMGYGVLSAFHDMQVTPKATFVECGTAAAKLYITMCDETDTVIKMCSQPNPPSIVASGLRIAVNLAEGKTLDEAKLGGLYGTACIYDVHSWYTEDDFQEMYDLVAEKGDDYLLTEYWTDEEAQVFFK